MLRCLWSGSPPWTAMAFIGEPEVAPIKEWLDAVASSAPQQRRDPRTLLGAVATARQRVDALARAADDQSRAVSSRRWPPGSRSSRRCPMWRPACAAARCCAERSIRVAGAHRQRGAAARPCARRERPRRPRRGRTAPPEPTHAGLRLPHRGRPLAALVVDVDLAAAERVRVRWRETRPAGNCSPGRVARPALAGFADAAYDVVHGWQAWLRGGPWTRAPAVHRAARPSAPPQCCSAAWRVAAARGPPRPGAAGQAPAAGRTTARRPGHGRGRATVRVGSASLGPTATSPRCLWSVDLAGHRARAVPARLGGPLAADVDAAEGARQVRRGLAFGSRARRAGPSLTRRPKLAEAAWTTARRPRTATHGRRPAPHGRFDALGRFISFAPRTYLRSRRPPCPRAGPGRAGHHPAAVGRKPMTVITPWSRWPGPPASASRACSTRWPDGPLAGRALRPTTGGAHACVWNVRGAGPLLDWLGVEPVRRFVRESALDAGGRGPAARPGAARSARCGLVADGTGSRPTGWSASSTW